MIFSRFLFLVISVCPLTSHAVRLVSAETNHFEIVGIQARSVSYVSDLAEHIAEMCNAFLPNNGVRFPQPILITLRPEKNASFEGSSLLSLGEQGTVRLDFRWNEELSLEQASYAITQAFLTRYAIYQYGPTAPPKIKAWPVHALALESLYSLRPSMLIPELGKSSTVECTQAKLLLGERLSDDLCGSFSHDAYYFFNALQRNLIDRKTLRVIIENAISGGDSSAGIVGLLMTVEDTESDFTLDQWWQSEREDMVSTDYELFESMSDSRIWLDQMIDFSAFAETNESYENLRSLWKLRDDETLRTSVKARMELIFLRLEVVNPLYFNVAQSLGSVFEIALDEEAKSYQFLHSFVSYLSAYQDAKKIEETVGDLLGAKE